MTERGDKMSKFLKKLPFVVIALMLVISCIPLTASANSALRWWEGTTAEGAYILDSDCPVVAEHELLTFNITDLPDPYSDEIDEYRDTVTAEYTLYNPADYEVKADLVFPFGKKPYYYEGIDHSLEVKVNGEEADGRLRHSYFMGDYQDFNSAVDVPKIEDTYTYHTFLKPDTPVYEYIYKVSEFTSNEGNGYVLLRITPNIDTGATRLIIDEIGEGTTVFGFDASEESYEELYVNRGDTFRFIYIGDEPSAPPTLELYEYTDASPRKLVSVVGTVTQLSDDALKTGAQDFESYVMSYRKEGSEVLDTDWYNASVAYILDNYNYDFFYSPDSFLMQWYEYSLTFAPGERITNTVTAPLYPDIDGEYEPYIYTYSYLLSPASLWADFGTLDVVVNTPYYMTDNGGKIYERTENGYKISFAELPDGELEFSICESETPERAPGPYQLLYYIFIGVMIFAGILAIAIIGAVIFVIVKIIKAIADGCG